jgi:hypothetical protein
MDRDSTYIRNMKPGERRVRTHETGAELVQASDLFLHILDTGYRIGDNNANPQRIFLLDCQLRIAQCFLDSRKSKVGHPVGASGQFPVHIVCRAEFLDFTNKLWRFNIFTTTRAADKRDSATYIFPKRRLVYATWRNYS